VGDLAMTVLFRGYADVLDKSLITLNKLALTDETDGGANLN